MPSENDLMLFAHELIENAHLHWPKKDRADLQAEVESLIECAFDEWEQDQ